MKKLKILKGDFSGAYYATRSYKDLGRGQVACTGEKEDITAEVNAILAGYLYSIYNDKKWFDIENGDKMMDELFKHIEELQK